jgi:hypothetical protein
MCSQFGFVIFWRKDFGAIAAHKMLVKLTPINSCNEQGHKQKVNGTKDAVLLHQHFELESYSIF